MRQVITAYVVFVIGTIFFFIGFHDIDNGFNMSLTSDWNYEFFVDQSVRDARDTYLMGTKMLFIGYALMFAGLFLMSNMIQINSP